MRNILPTLLLAVITFNADAQKFSIQPQVGLENPVTKIKVNDMSSLQLVEPVISPTVGLKIDYRFKGGHGPYLGLSTTKPTVDYTFSDATTGLVNNKIETGGTQLQVQAGYQLASKKIYFKAPSSGYSKSSSDKSSSVKKSCGQYVVRYHCGSKPSMSRSKSLRNIPYMQLLPSAGVAYKPFASDELVTKSQGSQKVYTYTAGASKLFMNAGMALEFGAGNRKSLSVAVNYFRSLGDKEQTFSSTPDATKPSVINVVESSTSGWNATLGFPINLGKTKKSSKQYNTYKTEKVQKVIRSSCGPSQMKKSCSR